MRPSFRSLGAFKVAAIGVALVVIVAGCSSTLKEPDAFPVDETLERLNQAARLAFEKRQTEQAAKIYRKALGQAFARGDLSAITDARYNLAVCLMELGEYPESLDMIDQAKLEFSSTGRNIQTDFRLLEATILYRAGKLTQSWEVTETLIGYGMSQNSIISKKIHFLRGLIAAANEDAPLLKESIVQMGNAFDDSLRADRSELIGRMAMIEGRWDQAIASLEETADLRRQTLDYRRMAIALALSAESFERDNRLDAAALRYMQAGRSAALEGDTSNAEKWLSRAIRLSEQSNKPGIAMEARYHLGRLMKKQGTSPPDHTGRVGDP